MEKKHLTIVAALVLSLAAVLWVRHYFSPAQVVRRQLLGAVSAVENGSILGVMSKVSRSYSDRWGGSYEVVGAHIQSLIDDVDGLRVELDIRAVEVGDGELRQGLTFVVSGRDGAGRGDVFGHSLEPCRATLLWVEEPSGWRLRETEELDIPELREELESRRVR